MRLPKHPIAMDTVFRRCLLVNYAMAPSTLAAALPRGVQPDVYAGQAWLSVVVGDMWRMRPTGIPAALGVSYRQVVYRPAVRCGTSSGVHFLRSDANSRIMNVGGNLLSFFRFHYAPIQWDHDGSGHRIRVTSRDGTADVDLALTEPPAAELPAGSAFPDVETAVQHLVQRFAAYHPRADRPTVDVVGIRRDPWPVTVVSTTHARLGYLDGRGPFPPGSTRLDSVFLARDVPYHWYRLRTEPLTA